MFKTFSLSSLFVLAAMASAAQAAEAPPRSVSTTGESIIYVQPDEVVVTFGIETFGDDIDGARSKNADRALTLVKAIKAVGIEEKYIQADNMSVEISYKSSSRSRGEIDGYFARRTYAVKLKDVKLFEKLVDAGLKNGANQFHGFTFQTTELRKYRDQARSMAIKAAKEKAVALAGDLESKIGKPRTITEGGNNYYFGGYRNSWNSVAQNAAQAVPGGAEGGETLPLGQIAVQASVSVTFDLE